MKPERNGHTREIRRLGQNLGGYRGEPLDIDPTLRRIESAARAGGWDVEKLKIAAGLTIPVLQREVADEARERRRIYISTGIHGDEPAGPLAVLKLLETNCWPEHCSLWLCPCLNPEGFRRNRRENEDGVDLNRDYRARSTAFVRAHIAWLERQPSFDLSLCLHEDWEANGFYLYELNPDRRSTFAEDIIRQVREVCPIDLSAEIEGRPARNGVIHANPDPNSRPEWPEAFYLIQNKTRLSYTLEAPSDFPLEPRVAALARGTRAALDFMEAAA